ncbi:D-amino-acid transaminase [Pectobacterium polaris]|uniref:D-amino-acid transaminase n=1 Tax=Pectobacterium polaris TaxID=2042057 RepID=UPI001CF2E9AC|nr:D-amino-acid transaminase [Pectobacterium polaris]MCA6953304.1 D-amino-acid transaminase [Pectobacterium polaris]
MQRLVYVDGQYVEENEAKISVFDRGFLFADAVYEVTAVIDGKLVDFADHITRLQRSCRELSLTLPVTPEALREIHDALINKNDLKEGAIYLQLSRGNAGDRDFYFPSADVKSTLVLFTQARSLVGNPKATTGLHVVTTEDIRWHRRDIKTVSLLAASLAKEYAHTNQADDAFFVEDGFITEGSSCNCYIVLHDNTIVTRPLSNAILHGITRQSLLKLAEKDGIALEERFFTPEEAYHAKEIFVSSATMLVLPVVMLDGKTIGDGKPGKVTQRLREIYLDMIKQQGE